MRAASPWRALLVWGIGLLVWAALLAPDLERRAGGGELGLWRDAQLLALAPLAGLRDLLPRASAVEAAEEVRPTPSGTPAPWASPSASPTPAPTLTPAPTPTPPRHPTPEAPLRVLVIGDSIATDLGWALQSGDELPLAVTVDTRPASGLARPDYFDWPAQLAADVASDDPGLIVVMLGGNDGQPFLVDGEPARFGSPAWRATYTARVRALIGATAGRALLWVGLPVMRDPYFASLMRELNEIYRAEARAAGAEYLDSWALFSDADGGYAAYLPDGTGTLQPMRQADGIHLSMAGARRLEEEVLRVLVRRWATRQ